jgi:hypothetical protein
MTNEQTEQIAKAAFNAATPTWDFGTRAAVARQALVDAGRREGLDNAIAALRAEGFEQAATWLVDRERERAARDAKAGRVSP